MAINVSEALDSDTCITLTIERTDPGGYVDGIYVPGAVTTFKSLVSPQQPTPQQLLMVDEGERDNDIKLFICKRKVRTLDDKLNLPADKILFNGDKYRVVQLADWSTFGHWIAYGAKE